MIIFSKISSNEYNNKLEKILENKNFDENVKNLLLSMLYKIENGYNDYCKVKFNAIQKDEFMEKILNIVDKQCFEIEVVTPKTEKSKILEKENVNCKVDFDKGKILTYENEEDLLYSLMKMNFLQKEYNNIKNMTTLNKTYYEKAIRKFIQKAVCLNESEIIRDFDGWSWNNNIKDIGDIECNLVFQNIMMLNIKADTIEFYKQDFEKMLIEDNNFKKSEYMVMLTIIAEEDITIKQEIINRLKELEELLTLMLDKKAFLDNITDKKKAIFDDIKNIDEILNDKIKLRKEYDSRNSKLANKEKIFSVSYLSDILKRERNEKLKEIKSLNNFLGPKNFVKQKQKLQSEYNVLKTIDENLKNTKSKEKTIINMQIEFLNNLAKQIEQNLTNKEYLENIIYKFRYYCLLPISKTKCINDIEELQESIKKVMNIIIDNCIDKEIITNFSNSASLCYNILKYIFITKIIDLQEVKIGIKKIEEEKYVNETQYSIAISIYDLKETESIYNEKVYNLEQLNVRLNKRIPLFLK